MSLQKLQFKPGVNRESTSLANEGGWFDCDKVRFRSGYPEKIGGWAAVSYNKFLGVCRSLWNWVTLKGFNLVGVGTDLKFYVESGGDYYDITPVTNLTTGTAKFIATPGSDIVRVEDTQATSLQQNDFVTFSGAQGLGGDINAAFLNQEFQIVEVISSTWYTIKLPVQATAADTGDGGTSTVAAYQLVTGQATFTIGTGWGTSPWGGFLTNVPLSVMSADITATATTITVLDTTDFTASGALVIENEYILYSGKTATTFTGCIRGQNSTVAAAHVAGTRVSQATEFVGWGEGYKGGVGQQLRLWSQSNFGENLLFSPRGLALYIWEPGSGASPAFTQRGTLVSGTDVPSQINQIMVSDATRIVIAFGCNDYGIYNSTPLDPMLIRWSSQEDYTSWTPEATNQAGSYRLSRGSEIIGALQGRQEIVVWTDAAVYSMQYLGPPYVWGFTLLADNISVISPNAMATAAGVMYWMGTDKFYAYAGRVETLPCSVRQYVFGDINTTQQFQFFASTNESYSEIWWFYCSAESNVIDRYVVFNYLDKVWYYGTMSRTAWLDSPLRDYPIAATPDSLLVYHEAAVDDGTTNPPSPITAYIQSSDFDIGEGHTYGFVWRLLPDITFDGSNSPRNDPPSVRITMRPRQNPGALYNAAPSPKVTTALNYNAERNYNVQQFTEIIYTRVRGRQMAFRIESDTIGTQWQLGTPRLDVRQDGRR